MPWLCLLHFITYPFWSQALEWYDLPEAFKYHQYDSDLPQSVAFSAQDRSSHLQVPYQKHPISPLPSPNQNEPLRKDLGHINGLALKEVKDALKDMEITNQVWLYSYEATLMIRVLISLKHLIWW